MNTLSIWVLLFLMATINLTGCATLSLTGTDRPMAFHDTRLEYALLTKDRDTLRKDFDMYIEPTFSERAMAGLVLPFNGAIETLFWPVSYAIATYLNEYDPYR
ncbi:hypothetical protein [Methylocaldum sp.]|uniref:hypothetical protein n=1 Tax=Methylocaldum sp. TaxID=1969727 RepID=UPI002D7481A7|nr:hypothetical protein [Methylocaldum sp.]HYE33952.1 hypothetical protein [Methylocaldum sp.]